MNAPQKHQKFPGPYTDPDIDLPVFSVKKINTQRASVARKNTGWVLPVIARVVATSRSASGWWKVWGSFLTL